MVNDRGTIKWTSLMLPEHVEMLKRLWAEDKKQDKALLDEHELEQINLVVSQALKNQSAISITVFQNGEYNKYQGTIASVTTNDNALKIKRTNHLGPLTIPLSEIVQVRNVE